MGYFIDGNRIKQQGALNFVCRSKPRVKRRAGLAAGVACRFAKRAALCAPAEAAGSWWGLPCGPCAQGCEPAPAPFCVCAWLSVCLQHWRKKPRIFLFSFHLVETLLVYEECFHHSCPTARAMLQPVLA